MAAAALCALHGADVRGLDEKPREQLCDQQRELEQLKIELINELSSESLAGCDLVVVSPGVPRHPVLDELEQGGAELVGELELASRFLRAPVVLIGGTNGKSTVTALVGAMLERAGKKVFVGGNYGVPLCEAVAAQPDVCVVEISSFQAERVPTLRARVHALLNVSDDHLDRYDDFDDYARAKGNPFVNMTSEDVAVIPLGDAECAKQAARGAARRVTFSSAGDADVMVAGDAIVDRCSGERYSRASLRLRGRHNLANACAAIAIASAVGAKPDAIREGLADFGGLPHRSELVADIAGVRFYDDSKATNVGAAVAALAGLEEPRAVLIAGGRDKHGSYEPLVDTLRTRGRAVVLIGEAAARIEQAVGDAAPVLHATTMDDAVRVAAAQAERGDAVLLSPACSSFDMFSSFSARGEAFATAVKSLSVGGDA